MPYIKKARPIWAGFLDIDVSIFIILRQECLYGIGH